MTQPNASEQHVNPPDRSSGNPQHVAGAAQRWWRGWNPLWGWAVLGAVVVSAMLLGVLFGGDGRYS